MSRPKRPPVERFWAKVDRKGADDCWLWTGGLSTSGYGVFRSECPDAPAAFRSHRAHRISYELIIGPIPEGLQLDHLCRNRACVNPNHLEPVTHKENVLRGESSSAKRARQTHCKNGHEFSPDNTYESPDGHRECLVCRRDREAKRRPRKPYRRKKKGATK